MNTMKVLFLPVLLISGRALLYLTVPQAILLVTAKSCKKRKKGMEQWLCGTDSGKQVIVPVPLCTHEPHLKWPAIEPGSP
jgi:hypothetical protein